MSGMDSSGDIAQLMQVHSQLFSQAAEDIHSAPVFDLLVETSAW